jgi:hypothetical protein
LVGQKDDEDIRAETDEENFYLKVEVLLVCIQPGSALTK